MRRGKGKPRRAARQPRDGVELAPNPKGALRLLAQLALLEQRRGPYRALSRRVAHSVLERFPLPEGTLVEIGAGSGELRRWLPSALGERVVHTDPSVEALGRLRLQHPGARTERASAEQLPFDRGACSGVLGLCSFDALGDPGAAVTEFGRVLRPGGLFVHFLDMTTLLERPFSELAAGGFTPLPNLLSDPSEHHWPLDLLLLPTAWLHRIIDLMRPLHPAPADFTRYVRHFSPGLSTPFDSAEATAAFHRFNATSATRQALAAFLRRALHTLQDSGIVFPAPTPFHSGRYLLQSMMTHFTSERGFSVEFADVVCAAAWQPRAGGEAMRYCSLCLGHQRRGSSLPKKLLSDKARALAEPLGAAQQQLLVEVGIFAFVARRVRGE